MDTRVGIRNGIRQTLNILTSDLALEAMDRKQVTALVLLDLSKAFDSIVLVKEATCNGYL